MTVSLQSDLPLVSLSNEDDHAIWEQVANWTGLVGSENGCNDTVWCNYSVRDFAKIAYEGTWIIKYDGGWGHPGEETITNPTYLDLWKIADRLIRLSGDLHHCFIENFRVVKNDELNILELSTGS